MSIFSCLCQKTNRIKLLQKPAISLQIEVLLQYFLYKTLQFLYNRLLRKLATERELRGDTEHRTAVYSSVSVHEDSTGFTKNFEFETKFAFNEGVYPY